LFALKPENLSFQEAATVPAGGLTALKNLQKANINKGQKILINGASGSLGTFEEKDLLFLKELIESGNLKPVIDQKYPIDEIIEAHKYVDTGRKKGNILIFF
jgi:NADPH:quinone reductase-like Zn-dependent oxidoreductase